MLFYSSTSKKVYKLLGLPINMAEVTVKQNERTEGIFEKWDVPDRYARISESHTRGRVKGDVIIKHKDVGSTGYYTGNIKRHTGLEITIANDKGEGIVYIPQLEMPAVSELAAMRDSEVEYESRSWSSLMEGTSVESRIRFLSGQLAGKAYEGREFA